MLRRFSLASRTSRSAIYIDGKSGWRIFCLALLIAVVAGLSLRLFFSPQRIKQWADRLLAEQGASAGLKFKGVRLELSRESLPQFALELTDVEASPAEDCHSEPSIVIEKLRLPLNFTALLGGRLILGAVSAEGVSIDIDGLKAHCPEKKPEKKPEKQAEGRSSSKQLAPSLPNAVEVPAGGHAVAVRSWWSPKQLTDLQERISEFDFKHVEIAFEDKTKKVYLNSLLIRPEAATNSVHMVADVEIPASLTYNEQLPPLRVDAVAKGDHADLTIKAGLSEGALLAKASLRPAENDQLEIDLFAQVQDVPLSTLAPLITKSGIVKGEFKPRFMWMGCQASIRGYFQGLFSNSPLTLENCQVVGNGSLIQLPKAVRRVDGSWEPFKIEMKNVDLGRLLETFNWRGLESVFSDYGSLNGSGEFTSANSAHFQGSLVDSQIRFSNHGVHALQKINQLSFQYVLQGHQSVLTSDEIKIEGGDFSGKFEVVEDRQSRLATIHGQIDQLKLSPSVEGLYINGTVGAISGLGTASLEDGKIRSFNGHLKLLQLDGRDFRMAELLAHSEYLANADEFILNLHAPAFQIKADSPFFLATRPLFFEHQFNSSWVNVHDFNLRAQFIKEGGIRWTNMAATLENGRVRLSSTGALTRERILGGWVGLDFPSIKKLRWSLSGTLDKPFLRDDSKALVELRNDGVIDDHKLGLSKAQ